MNTILGCLLILASTQCEMQLIKSRGPFYSVPFEYDYTQEGTEHNEKEIQYMRQNYRRPQTSKSQIVYSYPLEENQQSEQIVKYEQIPRSRFTIPKKPITVEQYLKEVSPTTKTTYNNLRANHPNKAPIEDNRDIIPSTVQYVLQPQKPQYEDQQSRVPQSNVQTYQNTYLDGRPKFDDGKASSVSNIYVSQKFSKKPIVVRKLQIPKPYATEEDELEENPKSYEPKPPSPGRFQAKSPQDIPQQLITYQTQQNPKYVDTDQNRQILPLNIRYGKPVERPVIRRPIIQREEYQRPTQYQQISENEKENQEQNDSFITYQQRPVIKHQQIPKSIPVLREQYQQPLSDAYQNQQTPAIKYQQLIKSSPIPREEYQHQPLEASYQSQQTPNTPTAQYQQHHQQQPESYQQFNEDAILKYKAALDKYEESIRNRQQAQLLDIEMQKSSQYREMQDYSEQRTQYREREPVVVYKGDAELEQAAIIRNRTPSSTSSISSTTRTPASYTYVQNNPNIRYYRNLVPRPTNSNIFSNNN